MAKVKACLFELDGVICDTAKYHYLAWKKMANELGFEINLEFNETLKGVNRMDSLHKILSKNKISLSEEEKAEWANKKNEYFLEFLEEMKPDEILPGVIGVFDEIKKMGIKLALGTVSKNAKLILEKLNITSYFDVIIDGNAIVKAKPDPEVFIQCAQECEVKPKDCIVFEVVIEGVKAGLAAGCITIGIGDMKALKRADMVISGFDEITFKEILDCI